jgi:hypothetical protein
MNFKFFIIAAVLSINNLLFAQVDSRYYFGATYEKIDSSVVPLFIFNEVIIYADRIFKSPEEAQEYSRLVDNIRRVYPLSKMSQIRIEEYNYQLSLLKTDKERRQFTKKAEKELKDDFSADIKTLTKEQGYILLKLIYRETGTNSFEIIKEYRGAIRAAFWQLSAKVFGENLKTTYEPQGKDKTIEDILLLIEHGII